MPERGYPHLFAPMRLRGVTFPNRVLMAPLTSRYADGRGHVTEQQILYYERRAAGGTGGVIVEGASVERRGRGWTPHLSAETDEAVPGLARLADRIRRAGSVPILQLMHCGRQTRRDVIGEAPVAPSAIPCPRFQEMPRALSIDAIAAIVEAFAQGARRAVEAGYDGVEIHGAHGYLINQFLSPFSNRREDAYGGDLEGRTRFLREILAVTREALGADRVLSLRLSGKEYVEHGLEPDDVAAIVDRSAAEGVDMVHVSGSVYGSYPQWVGSMPAGAGVEHFVPFAGTIRRRSGIPTVAVGRILEPEQAEDVIRRGDADFVALGRALIADAAWAGKAASGRSTEIWPCIGCGGCNARSWRPEIVCITDPTTGREDSLEPPRATRRPHGRAVVVGGSVPGVTSAAWLASAGWAVTLLRPHGDRGGLMGARASVPFLEEFAKLGPFLDRRLAEAGVEVVEHGGAIEPGDARLTGADLVVWARPGPPEPLPAAVPARLPVVYGVDVLQGLGPRGARLLVVGRGLYGVEVSHVLARHANRVTLVTDQPDVGYRAHPSTRYRRLESLRSEAIDFRPRWRVDRFRGRVAVLVSLDGTERAEIAVDGVVNALGFKDAETLARGARAGGPPIRWLGDAYDASELTRIVERGAVLAREAETGSRHGATR